MGDYAEALSRATAAKIARFMVLISEELVSAREKDPQHISLSTELELPKSEPQKPAERRFGFSASK